MQNKMVVRLIGCFSSLIIVSSAVMAQSSPSDDTSKYYVAQSDRTQRNYFELGVGLIFGSAYTDALKECNPDRTVSGGGAWIYLDVGFGIRVSRRIYLTPRLSMLGTYIEYENAYGLPASLNSKEATIVFLPGVGGKYELSSRPSTPFITGDLSLAVPASDLESPALESGGISFGVGIGYTFSYDYEIALIYRHIPVKVGEGESYNLGGIGFVFWRSWSL